MNRIRWVFTLLLLAGCRSLKSADAPSELACVWTPRDSIRINDGLAHVEPPLSVAVGNELVMIGHTAVHRSLAGVVQRRSRGFLLAGIRVSDSSRATPIDLPPGVQDFNRVRVALLPGDSVVAVWQGGRSLNDTSISRLWTSTLADGRWSQPRQLGDWPMYDIGIYYASGLAASGPALAMAVPHGAESTYVYLRSDVWRRYGVGVHSRYDAMLPISDGFLLGVIGEQFQVAKVGLNGKVSSFRSVANGRDLHYPMLMASSPSEVVASWVDGVGNGASTVRVSRSHDGGETWEAAPSLAVEGGIQSFDAILRDSGLVDVTGRQSTDEGPWPFVAELRADGWRVLPVPRLSNELGIVPPRFSRRPGRVELYWGLGLERRIEREPPALVSVRLRADCQR